MGAETEGPQNLSIAMRWDHFDEISFKESGDQFNVTVFNLAENLMMTYS